jgi:hypothetical protein
MMADLLDRMRKELEARLEQLRPLVGEFERLQRAAVALARAGVRAVPGVGARGTAAKSAGRSARRQPATQGRSTASRPAAPGPARRRAQSGPLGASAARQPARRRRGRAAGRTPAPRGQTQAKVLAALRAAPGSTTATVATTAGIPTNTASATISRLVKQGRVQRLDQGGYAAIETPAARAPTPPAPSAAEPTAGDTPEAQPPGATDSPAHQ